MPVILWVQIQNSNRGCSAWFSKKINVDRERLKAEGGWDLGSVGPPLVQVYFSTF